MNMKRFLIKNPNRHKNQTTKKNMNILKLINSHLVNNSNKTKLAEKSKNLPYQCFTIELSKKQNKTKSQKPSTA